MSALGSVLMWLLLTLLLGAEFVVAGLRGGGVAAVMIGVVMAVLVALSFMRLADTRGVAAIFAMAGVFWLAVLLGLGGLDSATRHDISIARPVELR